MNYKPKIMKMKSIKFIVFLITALIIIPVTADGQGKSKATKDNKAQKTELFNGKNLKNWEFHLRDASVDPAKVFTVQNGVIHITGDPFGYMRTKQQYSDYILHVEWRYPQELTNSGVFVHAQKPDTIWPMCVEIQLKAGLAGDFVLMNGASINEQKDKKSRVVAKMTTSNEKPVGEWNSMDVTCSGNTVQVSVNGLLQNKGTGLNVTKGHICLQSEGKDIEFRNVFITKIRK
jgi:hypothetical protein